MKRVAIFGNAGGGKSTLARRLAAITGLPLVPLDRVQFRPGGGAIPAAEFARAHAEILARPKWIIDGYGSAETAWARLAAADTLVFVDLPLVVHYWRVTKRLVRGQFATPEGWPDNSPIWRSTLDSYRVIGAYHRHLTPRYRRLVAEAAASKRVHHLRSPAAMRGFLETVARERPGG